MKPVIEESLYGYYCITLNFCGKKLLRIFMPPQNFKPNDPHHGMWCIFKEKHDAQTITIV